MTPVRGEIWLADLNPVRGSEQAGARPVLVLQSDVINAYTSTFVAIPLTTNLRRAALPSCMRISRGDGGLASDSVALCHQLRVLDKTRFYNKLGTIHPRTLIDVENRVLFTLGII
jgi:mRNA interferase MazF